MIWPGTSCVPADLVSSLKLGVFAPNGSLVLFAAFWGLLVLGVGGWDCSFRSSLASASLICTILKSACKPWIPFGKSVGFL